MSKYMPFIRCVNIAKSGSVKLALPRPTDRRCPVCQAEATTPSSLIGWLVPKETSRAW